MKKYQLFQHPEHHLYGSEAEGRGVFPLKRSQNSYWTSWLVCLLVLFQFFTFLSPLFAQSDGLPRGAYQMPYTRYESEGAIRGGGARYYEAPTFDQSLTAAEASDQKYVGLPSNGAFVEWTVNETADGITMRFTMPDSPNGEGLEGSLDVFVNGAFVRTVDLTSYWAWQYFPGSEPENHPGQRPRMRFDEVHFKLNNALSPGDVLRIQKTNGDGLEYGVDFVEIERVPAPITKPSGFYSVTDYGAVPNDGRDDLSAFHAALAAAGNAGTGVYIPAGRFELAEKFVVEENNIGIIGAGMWHTEVYFSTEAVFAGGIYARASDVEIAHFFLNTVNHQRFLNGQYVTYKGFMGTYGNNSNIHHMWVTHFECGAWIAGYDPPYPIDITQNLTFAHNRIRNNYADGINLCQGTSNTTVEHNDFRTNGDDAMAVWPNNAMSAPMAVNNIFKFNTVEHTYRAAGAAIFGGSGHEVHHNIIKDNFAGSGIRLTTDFPGYHFENNSGIRIYENTIIGSGTSNDLWDFSRGAIEINATNAPINNVFFENNSIINSQRHGIQIGSSATVNLEFTNTTINGTGLDPETASMYTIPTEGAAVMVHAGSGTTRFNNLSMENIEREPPIFEARESYNLIIENQNIPLTGLSLSESALNMVVGQQSPLSINFSPANATNKAVNWSSSNASVATYEPLEGRVVAHAVGTAVISVTSEDGGHSDEVTVNVSSAININAATSEAGENGAAGSFVIETSSLSSNVTVNYTVSGTASANDYSATPSLSGSVILTPSNLSQTITITATDDSEFEGTETLQLTLQESSNYQLGGNTTATISIADNDNPPCEGAVIVFTESAPAVNQSIETAWSGAPPSGISNVTIGGMPGDFSGQWRAMYDASNLYVLVEVSDATRTNDSGGEWWNDDVVELFIDGDNSKGTSYDGLNDFQLGFRWNDPNINVGGNSVTNTTGITFSMYQSGSGYKLEVAIPWSTIGASPAAGDVIGFDVAVDDDDNGGARDAQIASLATTDAGWTNPSVFGSVYLTTCGDVQEPTNRVPVAIAGADQNLAASATSAVLDGSGSTDPDGDALSYSWSQLSGPATTISGENTPTLSVNGLTTGNSYVFSLEVNDGVLSATDEVQISVAADNDGGGDGGQNPGGDGTRGAYQMPYARYESEAGNFGGGAVKEGPTYNMALLASEATDRQFVSLPSGGSYVEWTVTGNSQEGLTLRYSVPDNTTGLLALYVNGSKVRDINLSSYWAWQYFDISPSTTGEPSNTPQGANAEARMRFDELHFILPNSVNAGDVIRLQKDTNDGNAYAVDFIELESVPAAISQPAGYLNIMDYGATPNDETNDAAAFRTCLDIANSDPAIQGIYIPAGRFINGQGTGSPSGNMWVPNENLTIQGAGMWHTEIYFSTTTQNGAGFLFDANNVHLSDFYMNSATNSRTPGNKAVNGSLGSGSTITNIWAEHFETGFWISSMQSGGWNVTDGLVISNCRIRNVYADGVNLAKGTSNTIVEHSSFRNCIDDAMATWSVNYLEAVPPSPSSGNIFRYSTVENNLRAAGLGFFGGHSHEAHHLLIKDNFAGPGIRLNTQFPAFPFGSNASEAINIHDITVIGAGTTKNLWTYRFGAIELELAVPTQGQQYDLQYVNFSNIDVINSQHDAVFVHSYMPSENDKVISDVYFNNVTIDGTGVALDVNNGPQYTNGGEESGGHGIYVANYSGANILDGWVELSGVTFNNIAGENIAKFNADNFEVRVGEIAAVTGVTLSPANLELTEGASAQLNHEVQPFNAGNKNVSWSSSNPAVASVDKQGLVTAHAAGSATITVTTEEGGFTATSTVTINPAVNIRAIAAEIAEGGATGSFVIETSSLSSDVTVNYTIGGTASANDYSASPSLSGSVTLTPSNLSQTITITATDDSEYEGTETLQLTLQEGSNYQLGGDTTASISIADNDNPPCEGAVIAYTASAPAINQSIEASWSGAPASDISNVTIGGMPGDFSGQWRAMYDASNLYVLVEVGDATRTNDSGGEWWNDDVVELFIDGDNSKGTSYDGLNDFQFGFRWNDPTVRVGGNSVANTTGINFSMYQTGEGYKLEVAIPWSTLGVSPATGDAIGFDVAVDDDDNGGGRDAQIASLATTDAGWTNPSVFGTVYLTTCGNVQEPINQAPVASAGEDQSLASGTTSAMLDGSGSTDPDGDALSYSWSQLSGPAVTITNAMSASATVSGLSNGNTYVFSLTVSDGSLSATDEVQISVAAANDGGGATRYRIRNRWQNTYLYDAGDRVGYTASPSGASYEWVLEDVGQGFVEIRNVGTGEYMHIENLRGYVQATARTFGWYSSRWATEDAGSGFVRIRNAWQGNHYIHVENLQGHAQHGTIYPAWWSAQWILEPVNTSSVALKQEGSAGLEAVSEGDAGADKLVLYPNPLTGKRSLQVEFSGSVEGGATLRVTDVSGRKVYSQPLKDSHAAIPSGSLSKGVYIVQVQTAAQVYSERVVVE